MIVKNESNIIIETLNNILHYIKIDYWVISDTGSTDNTQEIIKNYFYDKCIPGELVNHTWKDFGYNRTMALESAYGKTDYLFIFDADDRINGNFVLPFNKHNIYCDGYMLKIGKGFEYVRPLLINNKKKWQFKGVLHEYLSNSEPVGGYGTVEGDYHIESGRSGSRSNNPTKYYDDAIILENAYKKEILLPDKGLSGRYAFYCGRSYKDAGEKYHNKSIEWYKKLLDTENHWNQEMYYACLEIGMIYKQQNDIHNAVPYLLKTIQYDHERIEGVSVAIELLYQTKQFTLINALYHKFKNYNKDPKDKLFINKFFYNDRIEFFNAITSYNVHDIDSGYSCCKQILINNIIGIQEINIIINNLLQNNQYKERLLNDTKKSHIELFKSLDHIIYSNTDIIHNVNIIEVWNILFEKIRSNLTLENNNTINILQNTHKNKKDKKGKSNKKNTILISFTTCKRLDLFKETINSILNTWSDLEKIDFWFCVDDNSSEIDRKYMKTKYNWIEYYMKNETEKGHRYSMNIIWNKLQSLKPTYWIHIEDDFLFYHPYDYINTAINVLKNNNHNIHQVVFNKNYAETIDNYKIIGEQKINSMPDIVLHDHLKESSNKKYQNCHYWPHYSFRPSITRVDTILKLGNFDSPNQFFEIDYANRWNESNYKTAFFNRITHKHIGRLTSEIGKGNVKNAYELNDESQFIIKDSDTMKKIKIVNLKRRTDRKDKTLELFKKCNISNYTIFDAVDGKEIIVTNELSNIFINNDFGSNSGVIGCALSHLKLWNELINDSINDYYIIFEDDFTIDHNKSFKKKIDNLDSDFKNKDLIFIGYHMFENKRNEFKDIYNEDSNNDQEITPNVHNLNKDLYIGGTFSYSINKKGAQKLIDHIKQHGIKHGIDYLIKITPTLNIFELRPLIVKSEWNENNKVVDTDIQTNCSILNLENTIENDFEFFEFVDHIGDDIYFHPNKNITEHMITAKNDVNCHGFNTLGFFKKNIDINNLEKSNYFKQQDGIYIKKHYINQYKSKIIDSTNTDSTNTDLTNTDSTNTDSTNTDSTNTDSKKIRVKMLCNWCSSQKLCEEWSNMCTDKKDLMWNNIQITHEDTDIDYYVIINSPDDLSIFEPSKTIIFQMEPWVHDETKKWGVKTWNKEWSLPDPAKFLKVFTHKTHLNNVQWQINYPFHSTPVTDCNKKLNRVSTICSSKNFDDGHILRNTFITYCDNQKIEEVDVFGRENFHNFGTLYKGPVPEDNKYNVYSNYKYCLGVENNSEHNYATEKLWEAILCESLCFYWGCPNIEEYIDERAFVRLPLEDPSAALQIIKQAIEEDWWSQRIDTIKQMKDKILYEIGFFPLLDKIVKV